MNRIFAGIGIAAALAIAVLWTQNGNLRDENATQRASIAAFKAAKADADQTADIHRAHISRLQDEGRERAARLREIEQLEGGDAPLSDFLRNASGIVWQ